jgi:hypothetical protein
MDSLISIVEAVCVEYPEANLLQLAIKHKRMTRDGQRFSVPQFIQKLHTHRQEQRDIHALQRHIEVLQAQAATAQRQIDLFSEQLAAMRITDPQDISDMHMEGRAAMMNVRMESRTVTAFPQLNANRIRRGYNLIMALPNLDDFDTATGMENLRRLPIRSLTTETTAVVVRCSVQQTKQVLDLFDSWHLTFIGNVAEWICEPPRKVNATRARLEVKPIYHFMTAAAGQVRALHRQNKGDKCIIVSSPKLDGGEIPTQIFLGIMRVLGIYDKRCVLNSGQHIIEHPEDWDASTMVY